MSICDYLVTKMYVYVWWLDKRWWRV